MGKRWITTWSYQPLDFTEFPIEVTQEKLCVEFLNNVNGESIRLVFSNRFGKEEIVFEQVELYVLDEPAYWENAVGKRITLNGSTMIKIPAGDELYSDEILLHVKAGQYFCVVIQTNIDQKILTGFSCFEQSYTRVYLWDGTRPFKNYGIKESRRAKTDLLKEEPEHFAFYGVSRIDVKTEETVKTIACFGDSITHRSLWTGPFMEKLCKKYPGEVTIRNSGISGNRIVYNASPYTAFGPWMGKAAVDRLEEDVFTDTPVDMVIILLGTNDIFHPLAGYAPVEETAIPETMERGLCSLAERVHDHGAKAIGCTITPWKNCQGRFARDAEQVRVTVNRWIREKNCFDEVIDFDRIIADPDDPERMLPVYDSGDHVHPGKIGGAAMADGICMQTIAKMLKLEEKNEENNKG